MFNKNGLQKFKKLTIKNNFKKSFIFGFKLFARRSLILFIFLRRFVMVRVNCFTYEDTLKGWLYVMIAVSTIINFISIGLIFASIFYVRRLTRVSELIKARFDFYTLSKLTYFLFNLIGRYNF